MKKTILLIIFLLIFIFLNTNKGYQFKIEMKTENLSTNEIDKNIAKNIERKLLNIKEIKDIVLFSNEFGCNIYIKLFPFYFQKEKILQKITNETENFSKDFKEIKNINYIDNYDQNYQYFIVITAKNNYFKLKKIADETLDKLLNSKIVNDIKIYGLQQKVNYIYFNSSDLLNYNFEIEDIKNIIKNHNQTKNSLINNKKENFYPTNIENKIKSIEDIKKITINFKDKNFTTNFNNIFKIEQKTKNPKENNIIFNNKDAIVLVISKKFYCPIFLLEQILKKDNDYEISILNIKDYKKIDLFFNDNYQAQNFEPINNNDLYFFNKSPHNKNEFNESIKNRLTIYTKNPNKYINLAHNNTFLTPSKNLQINYEINNYKINEYNLSNKEIFNALISQSEGLICDYYYQNGDEIEIILKNNNQDNFIYSKKYKILINLDEITKSNLQQEYFILSRKNGKIYPITFKNPAL